MNTTTDEIKGVRLSEHPKRPGSLELLFGCGAVAVTGLIAAIGASLASSPWGLLIAIAIVFTVLVFFRQFWRSNVRVTVIVWENGVERQSAASSQFTRWEDIEEIKEIVDRGGPRINFIYQVFPPDHELTIYRRHGPAVVINRTYHDADALIDLVRTKLRTQRSEETR